MVSQGWKVGSLVIRWLVSRGWKGVGSLVIKWLVNQGWKVGSLVIRWLVSQFGRYVAW